MDRKKTIVAAVMINAGILTVLFIAAMTMRDEEEVSLSQAPLKKVGAVAAETKPLFKEVVEVPTIVSAAAPILPQIAQSSVSESPPFSLPPIALNEEKVVPTVAAETPHYLPAIVPSATSTPSSDEIEVEKGDSLEKLAKKHQTSVDEIIKLNQLPSSFLKIGQRLKIPPQKNHAAPKPKNQVAAPPPPPISDQAEYYTMKVGDNPWSIAMKHHIKVDELLKMNGLNEKSARKLKPGDRLRIR